ncbi:hypothetical protein C2S52_004256 [Perilla frutescens var. hirtella]|nr:hypothetical protein C2S51_011311 [Perilla frutescens var. frutescens]KAH6793779.1 hypothetical protein C2S52_004256 [Perilla frutescens var. hirtella]
MKLHKASLVCAITIIFAAISTCNFRATEAASFSIDLIHRDSLQSDSSSLDHVNATLQRSFNRAKTLIPQSAASADMVPDIGEYLMRFSIGTPKVETLAIADTGSDLTWIQCAPCRPWRCFKQRPPLFVPNRSSTYKPIPCSSNTCKAIPDTSCLGTKGSCSYSMSYGDGSFSKGDVAMETITLGNNVTIPNIVTGCAHNSRGTFSRATSGIVGLGGGKQSLIRQMGSSIGGRFSYCLVPNLGKSTKPSKMHFGDKAVVSGGGVATTPMVGKYPDTFYYLTLLGMSVGKERFDMDSSSEKGEVGNIVIDSGSTLTFLPFELYDKVVAAVNRQANMRRISDPKKQLSLCFFATKDAGKKIPEITAHFKGADVKLKFYNTFIMSTPKSMCFAFAPATFVAIYGNLAQVNFLIGYDLEKKTLSFKPTDCTINA